MLSKLIYLLFFFENHIVISISFSDTTGRCVYRIDYRFPDQGAIPDVPFYKLHTKI